MIISHYGHGFVKLSQGERVIGFNPSADGPRFGADIALISLHEPEYDNPGHLSRGERVPFVVDGPGEYEVGGIFIKGVATAGPDGKLNTAYVVIWDDLRLVHLGLPENGALEEKVKEAFGSIDILFVPVREAKSAAALVTALAPRLIVPVDVASDEALAAFLKDVGTGDEKSVESLTIKKKDLAALEGEVAVIES